MLKKMLEVCFKKLAAQTNFNSKSDKMIEEETLGIKKTLPNFKIIK